MTETTPTPAPAPAPKRTELCPHCHLVHPPLVSCAEAQAATMKQLLMRVGSVDRCDCGKTIFWVRHLKSGRPAPYTEAGLIHFVDCTGKHGKAGGQ